MTKHAVSLASINSTIKFAPEPAPKVDHLPLLRLDDLDPADPLMYTLGKALTMRRGHETLAEAEFVAWLCNRLPVTMIDAHGNVHVDRRTDPTHRTLFTAHTDTVHRAGGVNNVRIDGDIWRADGAALGADDGAGIALLCHLIHHGIPGYYIFFRGEECGGQGSSGLATSAPELFKAFDRAVAFDRANYYDVITHQGGGRCCSETFAQALADQLSTADFSLSYMPDATGVYTDTAEFVHLVPECTNVSVGYFSQHGEREHQDVAFLQLLARQLLAVDWDNLPVDRDPRIKMDDRWSYSSHRLPARLDYNDEPEYEHDELTMTVMTACERWLDNTNRSSLIDLIAEFICPEDPTIARRQMNPQRLLDADVSDALLSLEYGWDAGGILEDLYDTCNY